MNKDFSDVAMIAVSDLSEVSESVAEELLSEMEVEYRDDAFMAMQNFVRGSALLSRSQVLTHGDIEKFKRSLTEKKRVYAKMPKWC